jgi:UDP-N-acetylglucosamine:LPS N-acetylglucosamine transferase
VLAERIAMLLDDEPKLAGMGERARAWSRPDAAVAVADLVVGADGGA